MELFFAIFRDLGEKSILLSAGDGFDFEIRLKGSTHQVLTQYEKSIQKIYVYVSDVL